MCCTLFIIQPTERQEEAWRGVLSKLTYLHLEERNNNSHRNKQTNKKLKSGNFTIFFPSNAWNYSHLPPFFFNFHLCYTRKKFPEQKENVSQFNITTSALFYDSGTSHFTVVCLPVEFGVTWQTEETLEMLCHITSDHRSAPSSSLLL